jgi:hypothetical protein
MARQVTRIEGAEQVFTYHEHHVPFHAGCNKRAANVIVRENVVLYWILPGQRGARRDKQKEYNPHVKAG